MVDMGQADRSLRQKPASEQKTMCWSTALKLAAQQMGYSQYMEVPDERVEELKALAHKLRT